MSWLDKKWIEWLLRCGEKNLNKKKKKHKDLSDISEFFDIFHHVYYNNYIYKLSVVSTIIRNMNVIIHDLIIIGIVNVYLFIKEQINNSRKKIY